MPKYKAGDKVMVNNQLMEIRSWPEDDQGYFFAVAKTDKGTEIQGTYWTGDLKDSMQPDPAFAGVVDDTVIHTADTALVESGEPLESTAGDISSVAAEVEAEENGAKDAG